MIRSCLRALLLHVGIAVASSGFQAALDDIAAFHRQDAAALARTLESLSTIATRLQLEPDNPKYRNIRLLNKTFWERVGSVNGGIAFMSSLGFDLLGQGEKFSLAWPPSTCGVPRIHGPMCSFDFSSTVLWLASSLLQSRLFSWDPHSVQNREAARESLCVHHNYEYYLSAVPVFCCAGRMRE